MATPSCESEGLSLHSHWLVFLSKSVLPPWNCVGTLAEVTIGATALISCVSGPMIPTTLLAASSWLTAGFESASSHCVSAWAMLSCWPRMPPASLIAFCATCDPWSMACPRLARLPVKHESTPMVTALVGSLPEDDVLLPPHAASTHIAATEPATRRRVPAFRWLTIISRPLQAKAPPVLGEISPGFVRCQWLDHRTNSADKLGGDGRALPPRAAPAWGPPPLFR